MKSFKDIINGNINEASYIGNLGFSEMVIFYQKATDKQIKDMEKAAKENDENKFKSLIKKVLGFNLI